MRLRGFNVVTYTRCYSLSIWLGSRWQHFCFSGDNFNRDVRVLDYGGFNMTILILLLITIMILFLYCIYKKICSLLTLLENESRYVQNYGGYDNHLGVKDWLCLIFKRIAEANGNLTNIDYALNCDNPAGDKSAQSKRIDNLTKLYAEYLIENDNLSPHEAEAKAAFEFAKFDIDELIKVINGSSISRAWQKRFAKEHSIEKAFFDTGILKKDCVAQVQKLIPHDVFAPVWELFKKQMYSKGKEVLKIEEYKISYSDYVKNRSIVTKLLDFGIIEKVEKKSSDSYWLLDPHFKFRIYDLDEIRSIIYMGKSSHDDEYFEDKFKEGRLPRLFEVDIFFNIGKSNA